VLWERFSDDPLFEEVLGSLSDLFVCCGGERSDNQISSSSLKRGEVLNLFANSYAPPLVVDKTLCRTSLICVETLFSICKEQLC
jgi:hypothetical protein